MFQTNKAARNASQYVLILRKKQYQLTVDGYPLAQLEHKETVLNCAFDPITIIHTAVLTNQKTVIGNVNDECER